MLLSTLTALLTAALLMSSSVYLDIVWVDSRRIAGEGLTSQNFHDDVNSALFEVEFKNGLTTILGQDRFYMKKGHGYESATINIDALGIYTPMIQVHIKNASGTSGSQIDFSTIKGNANKPVANAAMLHVDINIGLANIGSQYHHFMKKCHYTKQAGISSRALAIYAPKHTLLDAKVFLMVYIIVVGVLIIRSCLPVNADSLDQLEGVLTNEHGKKKKNIEDTLYNNDPMNTKTVIQALCGGHCTPLINYEKNLENRNCRKLKAKTQEEFRVLCRDANTTVFDSRLDIDNLQHMMPKSKTEKKALCVLYEMIKRSLSCFMRITFKSTQKDWKKMIENSAPANNSSGLCNSPTTFTKRRLRRDKHGVSSQRSGEPLNPVFDSKEKHFGKHRKRKLRHNSVEEKCDLVLKCAYLNSTTPRTMQRSYNMDTKPMVQDFYKDRITHSNAHVISPQSLANIYLEHSIPSTSCTLWRSSCGTPKGSSHISRDSTISLSFSKEGLYKLLCRILKSKPVTKIMCLLHAMIDGALSWILDAKPVSKAMGLLHAMIDSALSWFVGIIYEIRPATEAAHPTLGYNIQGPLQAENNLTLSP